MRSLLGVLIILALLATLNAQSVIQLAHQKPTTSNPYCESWKLTVETNNAGIWSTIPSQCIDYVQEYMNGERYVLDSEAVANCSLEFARSLKAKPDGKDAWVFDVDETLLSNLPYYAAHGYGAQNFDEKTFDEWVDLAKAPALPASLKLFKQLQHMGFKIFLLTGRSEHQRKATERNLLSETYSNWERLILRGPSDHGKPAYLYKSEKRLGLVKEGYRIHGSSGDQWSDLLGFATAKRSFKLPNPIYYIP